MRNSLVICCFLVITGTSLFVVFDKGKLSSKIQSVFHSRSVPGKTLDKGTLGKVLKSLNFIKPVLDPDRKQKENYSYKKDKADYSYYVNSEGRNGLPSTQRIITQNISTGFPVLSIEVNEKDLYDKEKGIIANPFQKGESWERIAYISFFENDQLIYASAAGIRIHGNISRKDKKKSFRLYFRKELSGTGFPATVFADRQDIPFKRLVVHLDRPQDMPFTTSMAFDIAKQIGCIVPRIKPVQLYLNGERQGVYWISDQVNTRQWSNHIGNENFFLYRSLSENDDASKEHFYRLAADIKKLGERPLLEQVRKVVDLENLSRYMLAIIFCGDDDWAKQGAAVFNNNEINARWQWIIWDMDHSFSYPLSEKRGKKVWEKSGLKLIFREKLHVFDVRRILFQRLMYTSSEYRDSFVRLVMDICNHKLTKDFLEKKIQFYKQLSHDLKTEYPFNMKMREFLINRSKFIYNDLNNYFDIGKVVKCELKTTPGVVFLIDGFPERNGYQGNYYLGSTVRVSVSHDNNLQVSHWLVNGKKYDTGGELRFKIEADTEIEPVLYTYSP